MADARIRERLFLRPEIVMLEEQLRRAIQTAASTSSIGATQILRDHYRDVSEPRHPVTRWS